MKYEEIVAKVKKAYAKADTALVDEHLAVQVDVTGEGEGAFYIEVAEGKINVEPWEYLDHDFKIQCTADEIVAIAEGKKKLSEEVEAGNVYVSRNVDKVAVFDLIVAKKTAAKKAAAPAKKTAKKETAKKETAKAEKAPKAEKPAKAEKAPKAAKAPKAEKPAKAEKAPKAEKPAKVEAPKAAEAPKAEAPAEAKAEAPKKRGRKPKTEVKA